MIKKIIKAVRKKARKILTLKKSLQKFQLGQFDFSIVSVNGNKIYPNESPINIQFSNNPIHIKGNICTKKRKSSLNKIILIINENEYSAIPKPLISDTHQTTVYPWKGLTGFECSIPGSQLNNGLHCFSIKILPQKKSNYQSLYRKLKLNIHKNLYQSWIEKNEPSQNELNQQKKIIFKHEPKINIIVDSSQIKSDPLINLIHSIFNQTYLNWELIVLHQDKNLQEILVRKFQASPNNKKIYYLNKSQFKNRNDSKRQKPHASSDFISYVNQSIILAPFALYEIVNTINEKPNIEFLFFDEDKISINGDKLERFNPFFKPNWAPDTLRSLNYIGPFFTVKKNLWDKISGFKNDNNAFNHYDFFLKVLEFNGNVFHIPKILYHQIEKKNPAKSPKRSQILPDGNNEINTLNEHLKRSQIDAKVSYKKLPGIYHIRYNFNVTPKISIIIPNKDLPEEIENCLQSILNQSTYKNYEIIIVDNGSTMKDTLSFYNQIKNNQKVKLLHWDKPFNYAAINNYAAKQSSGEILLFLNNDTQVINPDWLERMLEYAIREDIGAVGAKLYYPDHTIQHAGVIIGMLGIAGHSHRYCPGDSLGYFKRLKSVQNVSAVSGACLMTRKNVFYNIGGFDERFEIDFNDIDLCLRIRTKGLLIVWTPSAELYHIEMKTRGFHDTPAKRKKQISAIQLFRKKWIHLLERGDPYYNPNLSLEREDFSLNLN